jgi:glycosyltransferase involved in cell wall biosynthesis
LEVLSHGETGLLVRPDDPWAFTDAIILLTENPGYAEKLSAAAFSSAAEKVSVKKHTEALLELYAEVAERGPSIRPINE